MSILQEGNRVQEAESLFSDEVVWRKLIRHGKAEGCRMTVVSDPEKVWGNKWSQLIFLGTPDVISVLSKYLKINGYSRVQTAGDSVLTLDYDSYKPEAREEITSWLDMTICPHIGNQTKES